MFRIALSHDEIKVFYDSSRYPWGIKLLLSQPSIGKACVGPWSKADGFQMENIIGKAQESNLKFRLFLFRAILSSLQFLGLVY